MNPEITRMLMAERVRESHEASARPHVRRTWRLHLPRLAWAGGTPASQTRICTPSH